MIDDPGFDPVRAYRDSGRRPFCRFPSAVGRRVADLNLAGPLGQIDIDDLTSLAATSARTISRLVSPETGLTDKAWQQRAQVPVKIERLSAADTIAQVAARAGFASTAAFSQIVSHRLV
ncbi:hypothetical protein [uncultured Sphingomonas sp.]|uniref:hypothetical protein n=1 Tax=uncultured Sphingomonas sp. TaxID=158754 RepID=UPI0035CC717F